MYNSITNAENLKDKSGEGEPPEITVDHMKRWNKLIDFAKEKGYAGNRELDHDPILRKKIFDEFNKTHPDYAIPISMVMPIQNEIQRYKQTALTDLKSGSGSYAAGTTADNFMKGISQIDGIFGQKTSQWKFPSAYINNKFAGYAPKVDMHKLLKQ